MAKIKYLIGGIIVLAIILISAYQAQAAETDLIINEVMANPEGSDSGREWLEIANFGQTDIDLGDWQIEIYNDPTSTSPTKTIKILSTTILSDDYLVIVNDSSLYRPCTECNLYSAGSYTITNAKGKIIVKNPTGDYEYTFIWNEDVDSGLSMEIIGPPEDPDYELWQPSIIIGGTPGSPNSKVVLPSYPKEVLELVNLENAIIRQAQVSRIIDGDTIEVTGLADYSSIIRLLFVDTPEENYPFYESAKDFTTQLLGQTIDLVISQSQSEQLDIYGRTLAVIIFQDRVFNTQLLEQGLASFYNSNNSVLKSDVWLAILQQAQQERIGLWESAGSIFLSELLPNPVGDDAQGEWIEIYNPSNDQIDLFCFLLDQYLISSGATIAPKSYQVFHRSETGITLNNTGDTIKLFFPGGLLINEASYGSAKEGQSWALIDGTWQWTRNITPGTANLLSTTIEEAGGDDEEELDIPVNSEPIKIKTGEYRNFENYLVTITGEVVETSGRTFYLDDGSGRAKVYIQAATGIEKPPMHKGDIFQVTGIVNLYRNTWRILPQKQEDIKLIEAVKKDVEVKSAAAKKSTTTSSSTAKKSTASTTKIRSPTGSSDQIASAEDIQAQVAGIKSPWWVQISKMFISLALVCLILVIFKVIKLRRQRQVLGGNFGDET